MPLRYRLLISRDHTIRNLPSQSITTLAQFSLNNLKDEMQRKKFIAIHKLKNDRKKSNFTSFEIAAYRSCLHFVSVIRLFRLANHQSMIKLNYDNNWYRTFKHKADPRFVSFLVVCPHWIAASLGKRQTVDLDVTKSFASAPGGYFGNFCHHVGKWYLQPGLLIRSLGRKQNHTAINL